MSKKQQTMSLAWKIYKSTGTYTFPDALKQAHQCFNHPEVVRAWQEEEN